MRGHWLPLTLLCLGLGVFAAVGWLSRNPDAEVLRRAESWPAVGPLATWFRQTYRPPVPTPPWPGPAETTVVERWVRGEAPEVEVVSEGVSPPWPGPPEWVWATPGTVLRRAPSSRADAVETLDAIVNLPRLERRGDWFKVWRHRAEVWVHLPDYRPDGDPPYGDDPEPPGPLPPREPDPAKLAAARELLGDAERGMRLGAYRLYTDSRDDDLLRWLDAAVRHLEPAYVARYGRRPLGEPREAVVLYAGEGAYRLLQLRVDALVGLEATGHASHGVAALFVGDRARHEVASTLLHELVHLLNRRALGPALPPWLDEGLCDDLAGSHVGADGEIDVERLGGRRVAEAGRLSYEGAQAARFRLRRAARRGELPAVRTVLELDWQGFVRHRDSRRHYDLAALWVRYLLDGDDGRHAAGFRAFLDAVAAGGDVDPEALRRHLDTPWPELDAGFRTWLARPTPAG